MSRPSGQRPGDLEDIRRFAQLRPVGVLYVDVYPWRRKPDGNVEFLLLRRRADLVMGGQWQVLSGKIKGDERIADAFVRQVIGKTGQRPRQMHKLEAVNTFYDEYYDTVMLVPGAAAELTPGQGVELDQNLHSEYTWAAMQDALEVLPFLAQHNALKAIEGAATSADGTSPGCWPLPPSAFSSAKPDGPAPKT